MPEPSDIPEPSPPDAAPAATTSRRARRGYFLPGFIALVALLIIGLAVGAGDLEHPAATKLVGTDIAQQIALGIQSQQQSSRPPDVTCPATEPVRTGLRFECRVDGAAGRVIYVTEVDDRGRIRWSFTPGQSPG